MVENSTHSADEAPSQEKTPEEVPKWIMYVDGAINVKWAGAGIRIQGADGEQFEYALRLSFKATNNEAEYEAMVQGDCGVKNDNLQKYHAKAIPLAQNFEYVIFEHIPRTQNEHADHLSCLATTYFDEMPSHVKIEVRNAPAYEEAAIMRIMEEEEDWRSPIARFILTGELPNDRVEARKIKSRSYKFQMVQGQLYKRSHLGPLLFRPFMRHKGEMQAVPHRPMTEMTLVLCPVTFAMWGTDFVGQFLKPPVKYKDAIVAVDYFSKWVEVVPMRNTRGKDVEEFIWKNIITRFGIPKIIVSDNGPQFDVAIIREMCQRLGIEHRFVPVCYPQYNGQVEVMNRTIFLGIKKNLLESGAKRYEELDRVLWSYRTTPSNATRETPFSLVYGTEAVLPLEVCLPNIRQIGFKEDHNDTRIRELLEFSDEGRDRAIAKMQKYKQAMAKFYNRRVKNRQFFTGYLVLRMFKASRAKDVNKLNPKWEGPYRVKKVVGPGTYILEELSGKDIKRTWHGIYLKKYYV
ncbi:hypothetical protein LIER_08318 [Lithospermum erythrorhizon]|uniref:Integrase catalytic domain-containing protein n=1 Tax=Lithospermum erythrorhizon TaxID=34254 RepID=A0AAV3PEB5_LITER